MYYYFVHLAQPIPVCLVLTWMVLFRMWRKHPEARRKVGLLFLVSVVMMLASTPVVTNLLELTLQQPYRARRNVELDGVTHIVVLSAWTRQSCEGVYYPDWVTSERCRRVAQIYHRRRCRVIISGGKVTPQNPAPPACETMKKFLVSLGVRGEDCVLDDKSRNTYENAVESLKLLDAEKHVGEVVLVTSANHMLRSQLCFEKLGREVRTACSEYAPTLHTDLGSYFPSGNGASGFEVALHEYIGLVYYWLRGRI